MLARLFLFFTITTTVELFLLIQLGKWMGLGATMALIIVTGFVGAWLARREGTKTLARVRRELAEGKIPGDALVDGLCILIAGAFLLTPGVLTDAAGFLLLAPFGRAPIKAALRSGFERAVREGRAAGSFRVMHMGMGSPGMGSPPIDVTPGPEAPRRDAEAPRSFATSPLRPRNARPFVSGEVIDVTDA